MPENKRFSRSYRIARMDSIGQCRGVRVPRSETARTVRRRRPRSRSRATKKPPRLHAAACLANDAFAQSQLYEACTYPYAPLKPNGDAEEYGNWPPVELANSTSSGYASNTLSPPMVNAHRLRV